MPAPGITDHGFHRGPLRVPSQLLDGAARARDKLGTIAGATVPVDMWHSTIGNRMAVADHIAYRKTIAGPQIEDTAGLAVFQPLKSQDMRIDQVANMNIIADAGAVGRIIIRAKHRESRAFPFDRIQHQRDQMGFGLMKLANLGIRVGPRDVEIAKNHMAQTVSRLIVAQNILDRPFRCAIGVDRQ
jgi:hypothetical protein